MCIEYCYFHRHCTTKIYILQNTNLGNLDGIANGGPNILPDGSIDVPPLDGLVPESPHGAGVHMSNSGCPSSMGQSPIMTSTSPGSPSLSSLQPSLQGKCKSCEIVYRIDYNMNLIFRCESAR